MAIHFFYKLKDKKPVKCSVEELENIFEDPNRIIAQTHIGKHVFVSTVFLGIRHDINKEGKPVLFETYIEDENSNGVVRRYTSWNDAEKGHWTFVKEIKAHSINKFNYISKNS